MNLNEKLYIKHTLNHGINVPISCYAYLLTDFDLEYSKELINVALCLLQILRILILTNLSFIED